MELSQIQTIPEVVNVIKVLVTGALGFIVAFAITPLWTNFLYKHKIGIKIKECSVQGEKLTHVSELHKHKDGTPTMGGVIVWVSVIVRHFFPSGFYRILPW